MVRSSSPSYHPGPRDRSVRDADGLVLDVPDGWELLAPGDALVTRRVKTGPHWVVEEKRGNKVFSRGVWAPADNIARARAAVERERASPEHARRLATGRARREREQGEYVLEFTRHVQAFLDFHPRHAAIARELAARVARHATPVGSGTVARTERIPVAQRAEAAVIAWMRHQTTAYDRMSIVRIKGERREVRRRLAQRSRELLEHYRRGEEIADDCPLAAALAAPDPGLSTARSAAPPEVDEAVPEVEPAAPEIDRVSPPMVKAPPRTLRPMPRPTDDLPVEDEEARRLARMKAVRERLKRR